MNASEWFYEGIRYMNIKNYEKAIHCFTKSLYYDSQKASPWFNLAIAYLHINLDPYFALIFYLINFFLLKSSRLNILIIDQIIPTEIIIKIRIWKFQ